MRHVLVVILLLFTAILFLIGVTYWQAKNTAQTSITPSPVPLTPTGFTSEITQSAFCKPTDLKATITLEPAAGNIYGNLTLQNVSSNTCAIAGNNQIKAIYDTANITITYQGQPGAINLLLTPTQTVYSKVHYPNGPQCQSGVVPKEITFQYQITTSDHVVFATPTGTTKQRIVTCQSENEKTIVEIWSLSNQPLN